jgi:hypothetical protein
MTQGKMLIGKIRIYKTLYKKLKIEQHEYHLKLVVNSDAPEELEVPAPLVAPVV